MYTLACHLPGAPLGCHPALTNPLLPTNERAGLWRPLSVLRTLGMAVRCGGSLASCVRLVWLSIPLPSRSPREQIFVLGPAHESVRLLPRLRLLTPHVSGVRPTIISLGQLLHCGWCGQEDGLSSASQNSLRPLCLPLRERRNNHQVPTASRLFL